MSAWGRSEVERSTPAGLRPLRRKGPRRHRSRRFPLPGLATQSCSPLQDSRTPGPPRGWRSRECDVRAETASGRYGARAREPCPGEGTHRDSLSERRRSARAREGIRARRPTERVPVHDFRLAVPFAFMPAPSNARGALRAAPRHPLAMHRVVRLGCAFGERPTVGSLVSAHDLATRPRGTTQSRTPRVDRSLCAAAVRVHTLERARRALRLR